MYIDDKFYAECEEFKNFMATYEASEKEKMEIANAKLEEFDKVHFVCSEGGKIKYYSKYYDEDGNDEIGDALCRRDFIFKYGHDTIFVPNDKGKSGLKEVSLAEYWVHSSETKIHNKIIFNPVYKGDLHYNIWRGFQIKGRKGDFPHIQHHLKNVWCNGNEDEYNYIIKWFAHIVQYPAIKPGVALVIKGEKGTGKSKIIDMIFRKILGQAYAKFETSDQVVGRFNAMHFGKLVITLEEAVWAGDKSSEGKLKSMITDGTTNIEEKGKDTVQKKSFTRFIFITNEEFSVPATHDERRFFAVRISNKYKKNIEYFKELYTAMDNGEIECFFNYISTLKFDKNDVLNPPKSEALFEDVLQNMNAFDRWLYDTINEAQALGNSTFKFNSEMPSHDLLELFDEYKIHADKIKKYLRPSDILTQTKLTQSFKKQYGFVQKKSQGVNCIVIPSVEQCMKMFENHYGCRVQWDDKSDIIDEYFPTKKPSSVDDLIAKINEPSTAFSSEYEQLMEELKQLGKAS